MSIRRRLIGVTTAIAIATSAALSVSPALAAPVTDTKTPKAIAVRTVTVGSNPYDVAVAQNLGQAFVVNDGSVSVVSLLTHRQIAEFGTGEGHDQNTIALVRNNTKGYITDNADNRVTVFDTETRKLAGHITVGYGATDVIKANTPNGQRAYVITAVESAPQNSGARNQLIAINTATGKVIKRTALPAEPGSLTVAKGGKSIWVGNENDGHLWKVSTTTGKITKTLKPTKAGPVLSMTVAPGGKKLWVTGLAGVAVLNAKTGKPVKFITAPKIANGYPLLNYLAFNGSGRYAYVVNSVQNNEDGQGQVAAINTRTYKVAWRIKTGSTPLGIATDTTHRTAYVPNYDDDTLTYFPITK
jgi:DNA-binding beta-propeller fold protein YncE